MIYVNLGDTSNNKTISHSNIDFVLPKNNKEIQIHKKNEKLIIIDGFFFCPKDVCKLIKCNYYQNQAEIISNLSDSDIEKFLIKVDGFFNLFVIDLEKPSIKVFSDHVGSKQVYFAFFDGDLFLSKDIKNILRKFRKPKLNKSKLTEYFSLMNNFCGETFYEGIYEIKARESISFNQNSFKRREYFKFAIDTNNLSVEQNSVLLRNSFLKSVDNCAYYYSGKIATALSGGLDSSSITSGLKFINKKDFVSKTATFIHDIESEGKKSYELNYSRHLSSKLNIKQDEIPLFETGCISDLKETSNIFCEPKLLVNGYIHHAIFKNLKAQNIEIYLDGFAGDSVINHGYSLLVKLAKKFKFNELIRLDKLIHANKGGKYSLKRTIFKYIIPSFLPEKFLWHLQNLIQRGNIYKRFELKLGAKNRFKNLYSELLRRYGCLPNSFSKSPEEWHLMNVSSNEITTSIRDASLLAKKYGVNILFPFLSKELIQLSLNVPIEQKLYEGIDRYVFRLSMQNIVPSKILNRNTKSDLSLFSKKQARELEYSHIEKIINLRCKGLFDELYLREEVFNGKGDTSEAYQVYEFVFWMEKNDLYLE